MPQELEDPTVLEGSDLPVTFRASSNASVPMGSFNAVQRRSLQVEVDRRLWRGSFNSFFLKKSLTVKLILKTYPIIINIQTHWPPICMFNEASIFYEIF